MLYISIENDIIWSHLAKWQRCLSFIFRLPEGSNAAEFLPSDRTTKVDTKSSANRTTLRTTQDTLLLPIGLLWHAWGVGFSVVDASILNANVLTDPNPAVDKCYQSTEARRKAHNYGM